MDDGGYCFNWKSLPSHHDEAQVLLDVNRSFVYYPQKQSEDELKARRLSLEDVLCSTLRNTPELSYFQGFHDIAQVFLLVLGQNSSKIVLQRLAVLKIRDFLLPTMEGTTLQLQLVPAILYVADPELCRHLAGLQPYFALAATITMFAHEIDDYQRIARIFDYLLASEAVTSLYMIVRIIVSRREELLLIDEDEQDMLYATLTKFPNSLDIDTLILNTESLMQSHPPATLPWRSWRKISKYSVLKTTHDIDGVVNQSLKFGLECMKKQSQEIKRQALIRSRIQMVSTWMKLYRKLSLAVIIAIGIGVISIWLRDGNIMQNLSFRSIATWYNTAMHHVQNFIRY